MLKLVPLVVAGAARAGLAPAAKIAGPSNIGNYLAGLAIPAEPTARLSRWWGEPRRS